MKQLLGLAALLAGCATASAQSGVQNATEIQRPMAVQASAPVEYTPTAAPAMNYPVLAPECMESGPIVTMDSRSYTIECGEYTFIHFEHEGQRDVNGNVVLEPACENTLREYNPPVFIIPLVTESRWIDSGCDGSVNLLETYSGMEGGEMSRDQRTAEPEERWQNAYTRALNNIGQAEIERVWRSWWNVP